MDFCARLRTDIPNFPKRPDRYLSLWRSNDTAAPIFARSSSRTATPGSDINARSMSLSRLSHPFAALPKRWIARIQRPSVMGIVLDLMDSMTSFCFIR